jgi:zinc transporter ZupT
MSPSPAGTGYQITNPLGSNNLDEILQRLASALIDLAIPVAAVMYLYAGFLWLTAGAKSENYTKAKTVFKYTTIGLVVIFIGGGFVDLIRSVLNLGN